MAGVGCNHLVQGCLPWWGEVFESAGGDRQEGEPEAERVRSEAELVVLKSWEWPLEALAGGASTPPGWKRWPCCLSRRRYWLVSPLPFLHKIHFPRHNGNPASGPQVTQPS